MTGHVGDARSTRGGAVSEHHRRATPRTTHMLRESIKNLNGETVALVVCGSDGRKAKLSFLFSATYMCRGNGEPSRVVFDGKPTQPWDVWQSALIVVKRSNIISVNRNVQPIEVEVVI